jgi:4-hydroxymandelate oxidase
MTNPDRAGAGTARTPLNVAEYEAAARSLLSAPVYDYYAGGAEDELTLRWNEAAFGRFMLRARVLVDVSRTDPSLTLLGERLAMPVLLGPTAFQRLANADGELATARAARAANTILIASTLSTVPVEEIASEAGTLWLQLYVFRDRGITQALVERAEAAGCKAICLTLTVPVQGNRERDSRNSFTLPAGVEMANFVGLRQSRFPDADGSRLNAFIGQEFDASLSWDSVAWLRSITRLPIVLKGILTPEDGALAVEHGADAVIVSNHGGRQLDGGEPTLLALPRVAAAVGGRIPVLVDGGVRRGADVVKAICLGATAVLIARPYLWGLAVGGQEGVESVLGILRGEIERTMALLGRPTLGLLDESALVPTPPDLSLGVPSAVRDQR